MISIAGASAPSRDGAVSVDSADDNSGTAGIYLISTVIAIYWISAIYIAYVHLCVMFSVVENRPVTPGMVKSVRRKFRGIFAEFTAQEEIPVLKLEGSIWTASGFGHIHALHHDASFACWKSFP